MAERSRTSAPDLEILGDQVTLHPSGYIEPPERPQDGDKERNLVEHMARFRSSPLECVISSSDTMHSSPKDTVLISTQVPSRSLPPRLWYRMAGVRSLHRAADLLSRIFGEYDCCCNVHADFTKTDNGVG
jgi:hypothetical protein